jgi:hypothetical protein
MKPLFITDDEELFDDIVPIEPNECEAQKHQDEVEYEYTSRPVDLNNSFIYEDNFNKKLNEDLYEIYANSPYFDNTKKTKKLSSGYGMVEVFLYFLDRIEEPEQYSFVERFNEIASFMEMDIKSLYNQMPVLYKQRIIAELDRKYNILKNKKIHKLF